MNETLCRALLQSGLTEEDVATRLQVDPKTVRRWLEGRLPYLRYRWALSAMVGLNETDLWPQLRRSGSRPGEVQAIYPHLGAVPEDVWLHLFGSAERDIGILAEDVQSVARYPRLLEVLAAKAVSGVRTRICLTTPIESAVALGPGGTETSFSATCRTREAPATLRRLHELDHVEIRFLGTRVYSVIYLADDQFLISQRAYGIPVNEVPALHLCGTEDSDMAAAYLASFAQAWSSAQPLG